MKNILFTSILSLVSVTMISQVAYVLPSPTDATQELTIYIDVSLSVDGSQNNALRAMLIDHPDDDVFIWTWNPASPVNGNGDWGESAEANKMEKIGPLLYTFTLLPSEFYGVDGSSLFASGISCLAKLKDGNAYADDGYSGEAKTEDLNIEIIPKLCDRKFCIFPEIRQGDDYVSITYDNTQESFEGLQNLSPDQYYVYLVGSTDEFFFVNYEVASTDMVTSTPSLQMTALDGDDTGKYRLTFIGGGAGGGGG
ncbi:MAG: hypothetical protein AAF193_05420, partial [Bacteroidota bacterium]